MSNQQPAQYHFQRPVTQPDGTDARTRPPQFHVGQNSKAGTIVPSPLEVVAMGAIKSSREKDTGHGTTKVGTPRRLTQFLAGQRSVGGNLPSKRHASQPCSPALPSSGQGNTGNKVNGTRQNGPAR